MHGANIKLFQRVIELKCLGSFVTKNSEINSGNKNQNRYSRAFKLLKSGEDVEGRGHGVIEGIVPAFTLTDTETQ
jgi:hypothetical protein